MMAWEVSEDREWGSWHCPSPVSLACCELPTGRAPNNPAGGRGLVNICNKAVGPGGRPLSIKAFGLFLDLGPGQCLGVRG